MFVTVWSVCCPDCCTDHIPWAIVAQCSENTHHSPWPCFTRQVQLWCCWWHTELQLHECFWYTSLDRQWTAVYACQPRCGKISCMHFCTCKPSNSISICCDFLTCTLGTILVLCSCTATALHISHYVVFKLKITKRKLQCEMCGLMVREIYCAGTVPGLQVRGSHNTYGIQRFRSVHVNGLHVHYLTEIHKIF